MAEKPMKIKINPNIQYAMDLVEDMMVKAEENGLDIRILIEVMLFRSIFAAFRFEKIEDMSIHDWIFDTLDHYIEQAKQLIEESNNEKK